MTYSGFPEEVTLVMGNSRCSLGRRGTAGHSNDQKQGDGQKREKKALGNFKKFGVSPSGTSMPGSSSKHTGFILTSRTQPFPVGCTLVPAALSSKPLPIHSDSHPRGKLIVFNSPTRSTPHWETYFLPSRWSPYLPTIGFTPVLTCEPVSHWGYPTSPDSPSPSSNSASRWWLPVSSRLDYELSEGRTLLFIPSMITY